MRPELFSALLAMDSYNRGYNAGINSLSSASGTFIGRAVIKQNSSLALEVGAGPAIDPPGPACNAAFPTLAAGMSKRRTTIDREKEDHDRSGQRFWEYKFGKNAVSWN